MNDLIMGYIALVSLVYVMALLLFPGEKMVVIYLAGFHFGIGEVDEGFAICLIPNVAIVLVKDE